MVLVLVFVTEISLAEFLFFSTQVASLLAEAESAMSKNETASSDQSVETEPKNSDELEEPTSPLSIKVPPAEEEEGNRGEEDGSRGGPEENDGDFDVVDRGMPAGWLDSMQDEDKSEKRKSKLPRAMCPFLFYASMGAMC